MDEPIIYVYWKSPSLFLKTPPEDLHDKFYNAVLLGDKAEFLRLLKDPELEPYGYVRENFLEQFDANFILTRDAHRIAMAVINGETGDDIVDDQFEFKDGWTPLHLASATPSPKLIKYLIQSGYPLDVTCDYPPLNLKQATPLDLALEVIDYGYINGYYSENRPWTLRSSIFELFYYVCNWRTPCLEVIRLLVKNTQNKEHVRKVFIDSAKEGKFVKVAALFLAAPELFLSKSLGGGIMSSIDELYLNLNSLGKTTDIQDGLSLLLDVFDLVGHMLIAYVRLDDPKVWELSDIVKTGFFLREAAHMKLGISSRDDYLCSLFKPVSPHAIEPPCIPHPDEDGSGFHLLNSWSLLPCLIKTEHVDIDYVNRMSPSLKPHEADYLRKAIDNQLSIMPSICTLFEGTTRIPNKGEKHMSYFPLPRSIVLHMARSTEAANVKCRFDFKRTPNISWKSRVMNPIKVVTFTSASQLSRLPIILKRLIK